MRVHGVVVLCGVCGVGVGVGVGVGDGGVVVVVGG